MLYDSNGNIITPPRPVTTVHGKVEAAVYHHKERSLLLVLRECESGKLTKPIQISASAFAFGHLDEAMEEFAKQLTRRVDPIHLEFNPNEQRFEQSQVLSPTDINPLELQSALLDYYADRDRRQPKE